ncbi:VOC family protein [Microtetraspora sp. AC03309]|uniref:VOC family protein n=1 Tax=Microtetraspora sp. AC03309 TaxID=2779376 RepID=UPI001E35B086|nr:VOC family protein [Microtetraspora sp. AC03309]MCC5581982.1 VOC family protein [Microtetraspora sp. AC03309]
MEVLSSRILIRPRDLGVSHHFYREVLGLAVYREFGPPHGRGIVFFLGQGFLEVSGSPERLPDGDDGGRGRSAEIWLQVRDVQAEHRHLLDAGVTVIRSPRTEPWGLVEMWIEDPDGVRIVLVEVPADHPLRQDIR